MKCLEGNPRNAKYTNDNEIKRRNTINKETKLEVIIVAMNVILFKTHLIVTALTLTMDKIVVLSRSMYTIHNIMMNRILMKNIINTSKKNNLLWHDAKKNRIILALPRHISVNLRF